MLRAKRLTAQQAAKLWAEFYEAHGKDVMAQAYGWDSPAARPVRPGERVWEFSDGVVTPPSMVADIISKPGGICPLRQRLTVGWGACALSLTDPEDDEALLAMGVFPQFQRLGYRHAILDWMCEWARKRGAKTAQIIVFKDNEAQYERTMREAYEGDSPWVHAGDVWLPAPGHGIFVRDLTPEVQPAAAAQKEAA